MTFKVIKHINPIGEMKKFAKPNCGICTEDCLTILKKLNSKRVILVNKTQRFTRPAGTRKLFTFSQRNGDTIIEIKY